MQQQQGTPTAATPVPQPSLAPPPPPPPPPAPSSGTRVDLNPTADTANALAQSSTLVDQVERDLLTLLDRCQHAYDADAAPAPDSTTLLESLSNLISLLSRSALGGFVPPPTPSEPSAATTAESTTTPSQAQLDQASERSQTLFKQLQAVRERAEIVRAGLARS